MTDNVTKAISNLRSAMAAIRRMNKTEGRDHARALNEAASYAANAADWLRSEVNRPERELRVAMREIILGGGV